MAHIIRGDTWVGLLQRFVATLWWPHPLVHHLNRMLSRAREEVCDNYTLVYGDRHRYARALLHVSQQTHVSHPLVLTAGLLHPKWRLEERVTGLLDESRNLMLHAGRGRALAIACLIGLCALLVSGAAILAPSEEEAIQHIRALGGQISGANGLIEGTSEASIPREWSGTVDDLDYLKHIRGIKEIWFSGTEFEEVRLEDLMDLERIIFNVNFYDKAQQRQVSVGTLPIHKIRLKNLPKMKQLDRLNMGQTQVTRLELIDMPGLTSLEAKGLQVADGVLASVSGAPNLTNVEACRPMSTATNGRTQVTDAGLNSLASLKNLSSLNLDGGHITDVGLKKISQLRSLTDLSLASTDITDAGLKHLGSLRHLQRLNLNGTATTDEGLRAIVDAHPGMRRIDLGGTAVTAAGIEALSELRQLTHVTLDTHQLTEESCQILDALPLKWLVISGHSNQPGHISGLSKIMVLYLSGPKTLTIAPNSLKGLTNLFVRGAGPGVVSSLFKHFQYLKNLEQLDVSSGWKVDGTFDFDKPIYVDDELMRHVAQLTSLKRISFDGASRVSDAGVAHLAKLKSLEHISIPRAQVTNDGHIHFQNLRKPESSIVAYLLVRSKPSTTARPDQQRLSPKDFKDFEIFHQTQLNLLKSNLVLQSALSRPEISQLGAVMKKEPDPVPWLQEKLRVSFPGEGEILEIRYDGKENPEDMKKIIDSVIAAYSNESVQSVQVQVMQPAAVSENINKAQR